VARPWTGGRKRLREKRHCAVDPTAHPGSAGEDRQRADAVQRGRPPDLPHSATATGDPRARNLHDLPGPDDLAEPVFTVGNQLAEAIYLHQFKGQRAALRQGVAMLRERVPLDWKRFLRAARRHMPNPLETRRAARCADDGGGGHPLGRGSGDRLPASVLGGMRQRIMIAMAISCNPALLIADEPPRRWTSPFRHKSSRL